MDQRLIDPNLGDTLQTMIRPGGDRRTQPRWRSTFRGSARRSLRTTVIAVAVTVLIIILITTTIMVYRSGEDLEQASASTTAAACPPTYGAWHRTTQRPGTDKIFVPDTPVSATMCRYSGPRYADPQAMILTGSTELSGEVLANFVDALNRARSYPMRCPAFGSPSMVWAQFHYMDGPDVEADMGVVGCLNASNGIRTAVISGIAIPG